MTKQERLTDLKKRMEEDMSLPLRAGATQLVFGDGNPDSELYFLGEAPGFYEDRDGKPFIGQAGKLLSKTLESIGITRPEIYISNIVRYRPPGNRDPEPSEIAAFQPYVDEEIAIVDPKIIITLGRFSMNKFIPDVKISVVHGKPRQVVFNGEEILVIPMYHPAAALRATAMLKLFEEDFQAIPKILEAFKKGQAEVKTEKKEGVEQLNLI